MSALSTTGSLFPLSLSSLSLSIKSLASEVNVNFLTPLGLKSARAVSALSSVFVTEPFSSRRRPGLKRGRGDFGDSSPSSTSSKNFSALFLFSLLDGSILRTFSFLTNSQPLSPYSHFFPEVSNPITFHLLFGINEYSSIINGLDSCIPFAARHRTVSPILNFWLGGVFLVVRLCALTLFFFIVVCPCDVSFSSFSFSSFSSFSFSSFSSFSFSSFSFPSFSLLFLSRNSCNLLLFASLDGSILRTFSFASSLQSLLIGNSQCVSTAVFLSTVSESFLNLQRRLSAHSNTEVDSSSLYIPLFKFRTTTELNLSKYVFIKMA